MISEDLATQMARNLQPEAVEAETHAEKLSVALSCLDEAARLFDSVGHDKYSQDVTEVVVKIASSWDPPTELAMTAIDDLRRAILNIEAELGLKR